MSRSPLAARFHPIETISPKELLEMHGLFSRFYENADLPTFVADIAKKTGVILVRHRVSNEIRGFSTVTTFPLHDAGRDAIGVFSGDTILHPDNWGDRSLKDGFARYALSLKLRNPQTPVYWALISKGYKTYLLMARNFLRYYPRHDKPNDPALRQLVEQYCDALFPGVYCRDRRVLDFGKDYQRLKTEVAPIGHADRQKEPAIRYFEEKNPEWQRGVELPCIGELEFAVVFEYVKKYRLPWPSRQSFPPPAPMPAPDRSPIARPAPFEVPSIPMARTPREFLDSGDYHLAAGGGAE